MSIWPPAKRKTLRVLVTGSQFWADRAAVLSGISSELLLLPTTNPVTLIHGECVYGGVDQLADSIWRGWMRNYPTLFNEPEVHPTRNFPDEQARDQHMVGLGAEVCITFADTRDENSAFCGQAARQAGIRTVDWGISTVLDDLGAA